MKVKGKLTVGEYTITDKDGTVGQVLRNKGSGIVEWENDNDITNLDGGRSDSDYGSVTMSPLDGGNATS